MLRRLLALLLLAGCNSPSSDNGIRFAAVSEQMVASPDWSALASQAKAYVKQLAVLAEAKPALAKDCAALAAGLRRAQASCELMVESEPQPLPLVEIETATCLGILKTFKAESWYREVGTLLRQILFGYQNHYGAV